MPDFQPKHLKKSDVARVMNEHLRKVEISLLHDHINAIQADHAPGGEISIQDAEPLLALLEAERDRLFDLAEEG